MLRNIIIITYRWYHNYLDDCVIMKQNKFIKLFYVRAAAQEFHYYLIKLLFLPFARVAVAYGVRVFAHSFLPTGLIYAPYFYYSFISFVDFISI